MGGGGERANASARRDERRGRGFGVRRTAFGRTRVASTSSSSKIVWIFLLTTY